MKSEWQNNNRKKGIQFVNTYPKKMPNTQTLNCVHVFRASNQTVSWEGQRNIHFPSCQKYIPAEYRKVLCECIVYAMCWSKGESAKCEWALCENQFACFVGASALCDTHENFLPFFVHCCWCCFSIFHLSLVFLRHVCWGKKRTIRDGYVHEIFDCERSTQAQISFSLVFALLLYIKWLHGT